MPPFLFAERGNIMRKKAAKHHKGTEVIPTPKYVEPKSVTIEKADNGHTVHQWGPNGKIIKVAKSDAEALRHAKEMLK